MDVDSGDTDEGASYCRQQDVISHGTSVSSEIKSKKDKLRERLIDRVSQTDAHFKHQQRGEPDLTLKEKADIAAEILSRNPSTFLARFGKYLEPEDVDFFSDLQGTYEVDFYLKEIQKCQDQNYNQNVIKNRRFAAMKELVSEGEYFSDDEMKWRDPYLYEQMVGQYLTEEEVQGKVDKTDLKFSNILLKHIDQIQENAFYYALKEREEGQVEEEEDSDEEEDMEDFDESPDPVDERKPVISDKEKQMLRSEFLQIMQERFMSGNDKDFDYSTVDYNADYDSLETLEKDEQEKYFDTEDPVTMAASAENCNSGSVLQTEDYMKYETLPDLVETTTQLTKMSVGAGNSEHNVASSAGNC